MYLKNLQMQGFKSFADKIIIDFNTGITSVVGPNGSGKSNIADAIRWVLGEQSIKTLRGSKMEDVIFSGTQHRKPVGYAQVSLTIDNRDNILPLEYNEVTVSRRVFRSGESEFMINKSPCRLKDIRELFLDTGIGRDGYSIIGQGRIDEILSNRSEDRRAIFEEASGIMKYKVRKNETERKLEHTEQNLLRINDIIFELESQIEPLRIESEKAKRYLELREILKRIEVNVFLVNIEKFRNKLNEINSIMDELKESIQEEERKLKDVKETNTTGTEKLKRLDQQLEKARNDFYELDNKMEKLSGSIKINEEKILNIIKSNERLKLEIIEYESKLDNISKDQEKKNKRLDYLYIQRDDFKLKLTDFENKLNKIVEKLNENEQEIENKKSYIMDKLDILSDSKINLHNSKSQLEDLKEKDKRFDDEIFKLILEKDKENLEIDDLTSSIKIAEDNIKKFNIRLDELKNAEKEKDASLNEKTLKLSALINDVELKKSRKKMLENMEDNLEGYYKSVKTVLKASQYDKELGQGIHGAIAQLINVDEKYETAITMALGSALQNIVVQDESIAKIAIEYLKKERAGRATFLPITTVKSRKMESNILNELKQTAGFSGIGSDIVSYDEKYREVFESLLGRTLVFNNIDNAIIAARKFGYKFKIVTLEGEVFNPGGSISGGNIEKSNSGLLGRARIIEELKENIILLKDKEKELGISIKTIRGELNIILEQKENMERELKDQELIKMRDDSHKKQILTSVLKVEQRLETYKSEKHNLIEREKFSKNEIIKYTEEIKIIDKDIIDIKTEIEDFTKEHQEHQSERDELHADINDYKVSVNSIIESIENTKENMERFSEEKEEYVKGIDKRKVEIDNNSNKIEDYKTENESILKNKGKHETEKTGKTLEIDRISEEREVLERDLNDTMFMLTDIGEKMNLYKEDLNRLEVQNAKTESQIEIIQNRLWDEYELTYNNALELKKDIGGITKAQNEINDIKKEINELGDVNIRAIEDYVKTKERYTFMSTQRDDLEKAQEKLKRVIYDMTSVMKKLFVEKFKLINKNFNIVFKELFDGGMGEISIIDEANILESGIEINVQPPGKRLQNMMLLSGGERAFTAIALLFAILKLRPTPFCILDEIEAALDDANVYRFADYIRNYSKRTQFVMITHRKGTMEMSDMLYGVTMEEKGVSKIVSMEMH